MVVKMKLFSLAIIILLSLTSVSFPQQNSCLMMSKDKPCDLQINGSIYHVETNGVLIVKHSGKSSEVKVSLPKYFYIEQVQYQIHDNKILFIFGITDDDAGSAIIARFDPLNDQLLWSTETNAFNTSPLLISGSNIYVGGIGMVAKLKLSDGKIVWQHRDLYERDTGAYNAFILPKKEGNIIIFKEATHLSREVHVDDTSGKILSK
jgi:outer membrane protein assembly factor BamB